MAAFSNQPSGSDSVTSMDSTTPLAATANSIRTWPSTFLACALRGYSGTTNSNRTSSLCLTNGGSAAI